MNYEMVEDFEMSDDEFIELMLEGELFDQAVESEYEQNMLDAEIEHSLEDAMIEASLERAYDDTMIESMIYSRSTIDSKDSLYYVYDQSYEHKTVEQLDPSEEMIFAIKKQYEKSSKSGKTAYFSYTILNGAHQRLAISNDDISCDGADEEQWVSWEYSNEGGVNVNHYSRDLNEISSTLLYPLEYNFAKLIPLDKFNPLNFHFQKLDFYSNNNAVSCGDKFALCTINSLKNFQKFLIKDFAINIVKLMNEASQYSSINEYVLVKLLSIANDYIVEIEGSSNPHKQLSYKNLTLYVDVLIDSRIKFVKSEIKQDLNSELSLLLAKYENQKLKMEQVMM